MDFMLAGVMAWSLAGKSGCSKGQYKQSIPTAGQQQSDILEDSDLMGLNLVVVGAVAVANRSIFMIAVVIGFNSGRASVSKVVTPVLDASNNGF